MSPSRTTPRAGALAGSSLLAIALAHPVAAQTTPEPSAGVAPGQPSQSAPASDPKVERASKLSEVVVTADAYANAKTIAAKKQLSVVSDGISANEIGELPEFGLGDALSSVPGVTFVINNGRGEDQFMTIRGLNPDYNSTTVDGMVLPSTEETVRSLSFDVLPAVVVNQANVLKTWTVDLPSDAVGGVTDLRTRSAMDHPGLFVSGHLDGAYWENTQRLHDNVPSGQGDLVVSKTWGANDQFGLLALGSYYQRSSSTLNTYTLPYSYYPFSGAPGAYTAVASPTAPQSATATNSTLAPSQSVISDVPIPDRHRWYSYDNVRTRPGAFLRFDFDDHTMWHAYLTAGAFAFKNDENRNSQYLNRVGPATIATATTGSFANGSGEVDFDKYIQYRNVQYVDGGFGVTLDHNTHFDVNANYGIGRYRQNTAEDQFTQPFSAKTPGALAFNYDLSTLTAPLFTAANGNFYNPALYNQVYHLDAVDESKSKLPQIRADFSHNFDPADRGFGFSAGAQWRDLHQAYAYNQVRLNPVATPQTLATVGGVSPLNLPLYDGYGQTLLLISPRAVDTFIAANPALYAVENDTAVNTVNNYVLDEEIVDGYVQADFRADRFFVVAGVRLEQTYEDIQNYFAVPNTPNTFTFTRTDQDYFKVLPSLNVSFTPIKQITLRGAITRTLGRPEYSQLAQNATASLNIGAAGTASESLSNPNLKPRESTNYDVSAEWYPMAGALVSVAAFDKEIDNEILSLTTSTPNVTIPGYPTPITLSVTQPQNGDHARIRGIEFNIVDASFSFLPGRLKGFGGRLNAAFMDFNAPHIRMSDGTLRHLPQLISSSRDVVNAALFYNEGPFSAEVSYNLTGKMPISFDTNNAVNDQWWAPIETVDGQVRYALTPNIDLRFQLKNIGNARPQKVVGPTENLNYSTLDNGRAYFFGVAVHY